MGLPKSTFLKAREVCCKEVIQRVQSKLVKKERMGCMSHIPFQVSILNFLEWESEWERVSILQGIDSKSTHEVSEKRVRGARR